MSDRYDRHHLDRATDDGMPEAPDHLHAPAAPGENDPPAAAADDRLLVGA